MGLVACDAGEGLVGWHGSGKDAQRPMDLHALVPFERSKPEENNVKDSFAIEAQGTQTNIHESGCCD